MREKVIYSLGIPNPGVFRVSGLDNVKTRVSGSGSGL